MKKLSIFVVTLIMTFALALPTAVFADVDADVQADDIEMVSEGDGSVTEPEAVPEPVFAAPVVNAEVVNDAIVVTWEAVPGAKKYRLYRSYSLTGTKTKVKETTALKYSDTKNKSGKTAYYFVKAYDGKKWTGYSAEPATGYIMRIFIETGHGIDSKGKWDSGATWKHDGVKYQEAKLMLPIARAMADNMKRCGVYVYTDAYSNNNKNLFWTLDFLKNHKVSAFVNIHCDYSKAKSGTLPLYRTSEQKKLAKALNEGVHSEVNIKHRGYSKRKDLKTLNSKKVGAPACLFETGSIKADNKLLRTEYEAYGKGLAKGLCNYLNIEFVEEGTN